MASTSRKAIQIKENPRQSHENLQTTIEKQANSIKNYTKTVKIFQKLKKGNENHKKKQYKNYRTCTKKTYKNPKTQRKPYKKTVLKLTPKPWNIIEIEKHSETIRPNKSRCKTMNIYKKHVKNHETTKGHRKPLSIYQNLSKDYGNLTKAIYQM